MTPRKLKTSLLTSLLTSSVLCPHLSSVGQFSSWGRFWSNRMEITSFNSRVIAFFAVIVLWRFVAVWKETFLYALSKNHRDSYAMHCFFRRIRCCGNMITEPLSSNERLALRLLLRLSGVMSQYRGRASLRQSEQGRWVLPKLNVEASHPLSEREKVPLHG
jgi:hypothetical protein